ncbi:hypothetical protein [Bradyrhizobium erythrophlei]|nr:hypothetical protein [Bradyrhizobium erythrophlei]
MYLDIDRLLFAARMDHDLFDQFADVAYRLRAVVRISGLQRGL